jgi:type IV secretory pathway component VirB8
MKEILKELKTTRRCEATANEALNEAIRSNYVANAERAELQQQCSCTKRLAEKICLFYQRRATNLEADNSKLKFLVYCLLAVITVLALRLLSKK